MSVTGAVQFQTLCPISQRIHSRAKIVMKLTEEQKKVILRLGDTHGEMAVIPETVLAELVDFGLVSKRPDGAIDFTDEGGEVYDELAGKKQ